MAYNDVQDIVVNPEVISDNVQLEWTNYSKLLKSGVFSSTNPLIEGLIQSYLQTNILTNRSGQALKAGQTISLANVSQTKVNAPVVIRYDGLEHPSLANDVEKKGVPATEAMLSGAVAKATGQYIDDAAISMVEGIAGAITDNQEDDSGGSDITLAGIVDTAFKLGEKAENLLGNGILLHHPAKGAELTKLGVAAATSNTYGNALQDEIVRRGLLPKNVIGLTPVMSSKLSLDGEDYYSYLIGQGQISLDDMPAPDIDIQWKPGAHRTMLLTFKAQSTMRCFGVTWGLAAKEDVSDTDLATSANWTLTTDHTNVAIARLNTD